MSQTEVQLIKDNAVVEADIANDAVTRDKINVVSTSSAPGIEIKGDDGSQEGYLQLNCRVNSHGVKIQSPAHSASQSYKIILPDNQIAADKVLKVKSITGSGSTATGQLEFGDVASSSPTENYAFANMATQNFDNSGYQLHGIASNGGSNGITVDTTNNRLTPTSAGIYFIYYLPLWSHSFTNSGLTAYNGIYLNGSQNRRTTIAIYDDGGTKTNTVLAVISMNGSSDYVDFRSYHNKSGQTMQCTNLSRGFMFKLKDS